MQIYLDASRTFCPNAIYLRAANVPDPTTWATRGCGSSDETGLIYVCFGGVGQKGGLSSTQQRQPSNKTSKARWPCSTHIDGIRYPTTMRSPLFGSGANVGNTQSECVRGSRCFSMRRLRELNFKALRSLTVTIQITNFACVISRFSARTIAIRP